MYLVVCKMVQAEIITRKAQWNIYIQQEHSRIDIVDGQSLYTMVMRVEVIAW